MNRRESMTLVGGAAAVWSSRVHAQQRPMQTIGWLSMGAELQSDPTLDAFRSGLSDLGYREGKNIRVLYRYADGNAERLFAHASESSI